MLEFLLAYLSYNLVIGLILTIFHAVKERGTIPAVNLLLLLVFPAVGLGKWIYHRTLRDQNSTEFPENWHIWKYMVKVNWGFMTLIGIGPLTLLILMSLGFLVGDFAASGPMPMSQDEMFQLLEVGLILLIIGYAFIMFFVLIIPYLLLIFLPKRQKRSIERRQFLEFRKKQLAKQQATDKPKVKRNPIPLYAEIETYVEVCSDEFGSIEKYRKEELENVGNYIRSKQEKGESVSLTFICTHNSRRSQFAQIWAAVAAAKYGIKDVQTFSGGTEDTAFNKRAVDACKRVGFKIDGTVGTNPRYNVRFSDNAGAIDCFSKTFDNPANPQKGFAAIMTCSDADENCPIVHGAEFRARLTYDDPKIADRTAEETSKYDERCKQIATEMLYLFSKV